MLEPGERVAQRRLERAVDLDDVHERRSGGEVLGEHAQAAADLEHDVVFAELGQPADHSEQVGVDEEVLTELAVGPHPELAQPAQARLGGQVGGVRGRAHHAKRPAAVASIADSSSS